MFVCGLIQDGHFTKLKEHSELNEHSKVLHKYLEDLLLEYKMTLSDINGLALLNGPGSYTGLRTALAAAKGICFATQIPLILLNKMDVLLTQASKGFQNSALVLKKARTEEYFMASYFVETQKSQKPSLIYWKELEKQLSGFKNKTFLSDALPNNNEPFESIELSIDYPVLESIIIEQFKSENFADIFSAEPYYLKEVHITNKNKSKEKIK